MSDELTLTEQEAREGFEEMVGYVMDIDDQEVIEAYADTFLFIAKGFARDRCKEQREICATAFFKSSSIGDEKYFMSRIRNAPLPSI